MKRMSWFYNNFVSGKNGISVLDVGSSDYNGSYKNLFPCCKYTGLDMAPGKNVDICVENPYNWEELKANTFDVVVSGQTLEHSPFFWLLFGEIVRVTKKGGLICIVVPRGFHKHRYPVDCWRFLADGMVALCEYYQLKILHASTNTAPTYLNFSWFSKNNADTLLVAQKPYSGIPLIKEKLTSDLAVFQKQYYPKQWFEFPVDGSLGIYLLHSAKKVWRRFLRRT